MKKVTAIVLAEKIRKIYAAENGGEWVFEKGHITEGKLLKQACEELESQDDTIEKLENVIRNLNNKKEKELNILRIKHYEEKHRLEQQNTNLREKQDRLLHNLQKFIDENT